MNTVLFRNPLVRMKSDSLHDIFGRQSAKGEQTTQKRCN